MTSWPSRGGVEQYLYDQVSARLAGEYFVDLLGDVHEAGVRKVHVRAHSMGNFLILNALSRFKPTNFPGLGEVMMAAPDVDCDEYIKLAGQDSGCVRWNDTLRLLERSDARSVKKIGRKYPTRRRRSHDRT